MNLKGKISSTLIIMIWSCMIIFFLTPLSCEREETDRPAVIETVSVSNIGFTSFTVQGNILDMGLDSVSQHGFCWSTASEPAIADDTCNQLGSRNLTGVFESTIGGLQQNTSYFVRAYAVNKAGEFYGDEIALTTDRVQTVATVITSSVNDIKEHSARFGGSVPDNGGSAITRRGICWDTLQNPTIEGDHRDLGDGTGVFIVTVKNLELKTIYYVRAYAINSTGIEYGNEILFRTNDTPVEDVEGNGYPTIAIGNQTWMAKNLKVTSYADGNPIPFVPDNLDWDSLRVNDKAYTYYNNSPASGRTYGALYTWAAAVNYGDNTGTTEHIQGVCPAGWHLPGDEEWKELEMHLGMPRDVTDKEGWRGTNEGGKLKSTGREFWLIPNTGATNEFRFSALPAGDRLPKGDFFNQSFSTFYWTSTEFDLNHAWARGLGYFVSTMYRGHNDRKDFGFSVRCVRDEDTTHHPPSP